MNIKIIIWGYKLYSHTHSFIWNGFFRAFKYLGYDVYWFDDKDDVSNFDFQNCVFITEGNSCVGIPINNNCRYINHNCPDLGIKKGNYINIQYLQKQYAYQGEEISHGIRLINGDCLMFVWGSDLLPNEFDETLITKPRESKIYYLGTVDHSGIEGGNYIPITEFAKEATRNDYMCFYGGGYSVNFNKLYLHYIPGWVSEEKQKEYLTSGQWMPALQGERQLTNGMIPCRLFKAIQYGLDGITNNEFAHEFFNHQTLLDTNPSKLFYEAERRKDEIERKRYLFNFVKDNHTYINNIQAILKVLL